MVYNTTYTMPSEDARHFVIWIREVLLPRVQGDETLINPRLLRILSHHEQESECFSLQFEVEDTAVLHKWFVRQGNQLSQEMQQLFDGRIVGFSTLMEEV